MQDSQKNFYKKNFGQFGEDKAVEYLQKQHYIILYRNYRTPYGEVDIVAIDTATNEYVFCEVKTRKSARYMRACQAVNYKKQQKYITMAGYFIAQQNMDELSIRFDVIEVYTHTLNHIQAAFINE